MSGNIVWVDLEMTGLDLHKEVIIEMACIVTDKNLNVLQEGINIIIHQPDGVLNSMGDWCKEHHGDSGLTQAVKDSKISITVCEETMLNYIKKYTKEGKNCLAGNSIHTDKAFLDKYMPKFMAQLHYRIIDVSSVKELCKRWYPRTHLAKKTQIPKTGNHRALGDIKDSIEELKYYREHIFK